MGDYENNEEVWKFYGKFNVVRGKIHNYICIKLDFIKCKKLVVDMTQYIKESISMILEEIMKEISTTSANYFFEVNPDEVKLYLEKKQLFHIIVT